MEANEGPGRGIPTLIVHTLVSSLNSDRNDGFPYLCPSLF